MRACNLLVVANGDMSLVIEYVEESLLRWGGSFASKGESVVVPLVSTVPSYPTALSVFQVGLGDQRVDDRILSQAVIALRTIAAGSAPSAGVAGVPAVMIDG